MADIYDWSLTPATNGAADSAINWAEGMDPDQVNDSARQMMTRVAEVLDDIAPTRSTTGTGNAYAITSAAVASGSYNDGEIFSFIIDRANTSAATLNVNGRGAVALRPEIGREFAAGELRANQPIIGFYRSASNEVLAVGSGYHVNALTSGALTQSVVGRLMKVGTPYLSMSSTVEAGSIRLTQTTQTLLKADWPELSSWLSTRSYPWGSTSTTFNLPPAAGYFLRFAATSSAIDTSGARTAGSTQTDQNLAHTHAPGSLSGTTGSTTPTVSEAARNGVQAAASGGAFDANIGEILVSRAVSAHTHSFTVTSGATASSGGDEVRVKNVAFHVDVFASSALATGALAQFGFSYAFDASTTSSDPGSGNVRLNNATLASVTEIYISETDSWGVDISGFLSTISSGVRLRLSKIGAQASTVLFTASGAPTDNGGWRTIPGAVTVSGGSFTAGDSMAFEQFSGAAGPTGATGSTGPTGAAGVNPSLDYTWSTGTSGDPGSGKLLANNATPASATQLNISETNRQSASQAAYIALWDDSTTTTSKGVVRIVDLAAPGTNFLEYKITGSMTDAGGYDTFPVTYVGGAGTIANNTTVAVAFYATGDKGTDGAGAGDVTAAASITDNRLVRGDGGVKGVQESAATLDDSGNLSGIVALSATTIELGHATDTTISRAGAGAIAVEGVGVALNSTSLVHTAGTIELGHATDTTLARISAGVISVEGETVHTNSTSRTVTASTIELGHATDTTISRTAAGAIAVEGVAVKTAGVETIFVPGSAMISRTTNGAAAGSVETTTNKIMLSSLDFETAVQKFAQFSIRMPKSWNESTVTARFTWSHPSTTTDYGVVWALEAVALSDDDAADTAFGTAQQIADTGGTTNDIYISGATPALTIGGTPAAEDWVVFQVKRVVSDASDMMAVDARLHGVTIYITTDAANDA